MKAETGWVPEMSSRLVANKMGKVMESGEFKMVP